MISNSFLLLLWNEVSNELSPTVLNIPVHSFVQNYVHVVSLSHMGVIPFVLFLYAWPLRRSRFFARVNAAATLRTYILIPLLLLCIFHSVQLLYVIFNLVILFVYLLRPLFHGRSFENPCVRMVLC